MSQEIIDRLAKQILSQGTTDKWSGEGFGSAEANAKDMAKILQGIGITDIRQFGQIDKYEPVTQIGYELNGKRVQNPRPGVYYEEVPVEYGDGGYYMTRRDLTPQEADQVKPVYGVVTGYDEYNQPTYNVVDAKNVTTKDGQLVGVTGQTYGNKETGQVVPNTYSERQTGNAWGGTFAGSGNTGYRVEFAPDGTPYFYTTGASSRDSFGDFLLNVAPLALMAIPGVGTALGTALGASGTAATAIGNSLIQGTLSEASGGDFLKGAASGAIGSLAPGVSSTIAEAAGGGMLGSAIGQGITSAGTAALLGGDATQAGLIGAVTGAANYVPPSEGLNSPLTMAQIESGLGTEGYGYGAQAAASGLFNPAVIGSGAYTQTSYPIDMAEFAAADAMQLMDQGIGIPAVEQNLVASGLDPLIAADLTQQISLNPNLTSMDLANNLISTYGSNIYDTTIDQINEAAPESTQPAPASTSSDIPWGQIAKLLGGLFTMGAANQMAQPSATVQQPMAPYKPADTMPVYSPEYFQQVQQYYNTYLPTLPRDVATPLQDWYSSGYTQPDSVTAKLFSGGV